MHTSIVREVHFLSGVLMEQVTAYLNHKEKQIRNKVGAFSLSPIGCSPGLHVQVIGMVHTLLARHVSDPRWVNQGRIALERIAGLYFPLVPLVLVSHPAVLRNVR